MTFRIFFTTAILASLLLVSACATGLFSNGEVPVPIEPAPPPGPLVVDGVRTSYADVVERSSPAVVQIMAEVRSSARQPQSGRSPLEDFFRQIPPPRGDQRPPVERGVGSGVIVSADGSVLTNAHVVDGAEKIMVTTADNKEFEAKLVGIDKPSDLAVLKIEGQGMPYLGFGNSDSVRVGDIVLAIGNPLGIGQSVTAGIISAKGRRTGLSYGGSDSFEDFLQTDASINRGNSGGALVNLNGELVGINSQILSAGGSGSIGIGFAIPSNMAKTVLEQLLADGRVRRGMLGVVIQNITPEMAQALELEDTRGVVVSNVRPGSSAEKAGVRVGDIITAINGESVDDGNVLRNKIAGTLPGSVVKLTVNREGASQELTATLDEYDTETASANPKPAEGDDAARPTDSGRLGVSLVPVTPQLSKQYGSGTEKQGLVVMEVDESGAAADAGIAVGDIILEVNRKPVASVDEIESAIRTAGQRPILLLVTRKGSTMFLTVRVR